MSPPWPPGATRQRAVAHAPALLGEALALVAAPALRRRPVEEQLPARRALLLGQRVRRRELRRHLARRGPLRPAHDQVTKLGVGVRGAVRGRARPHVTERRVEHAPRAVAADQDHRLVLTGAALVRRRERGREHAHALGVQRLQAVVELVGVRAQVREIARDRMIAVDHLHVEGVERAVAGTLAPQVADELLVLLPALEGVVGRVDHRDTRPGLDRCEEVALRRLAPARSVVVEHEDGVGLQRRGIGERLGRLVGHVDRELAALLEHLLQRARAPAPVVVVLAADDQGADALRRGRVLAAGGGAGGEQRDQGREHGDANVHGHLARSGAGSYPRRGPGPKRRGRARASAGASAAAPGRRSTDPRARRAWGSGRAAPCGRGRRRRSRSSRGRR